MYTAMQLPFSKYSSYDSFNEIASKNNFDNNYRVMYNYSYTDNTNDTLLINKNSSLRYFSSVINGNVIAFFNRNGSNAGNNNYRISAFDSPLLVSLMGNKYFYLTEDFGNGIYKKVDAYSVKSYDYEKKIDETKDVFLYENPYALTLGYVIESDYSYEEGLDIATYQNNIIKAFTGTDKDVLFNLEYEIVEDSEECSKTQLYYSCREYRIKNTGKKRNVYVYSPLSEYVINSSVRAYLNGMKPLAISSKDNTIDLVLRYEGDLSAENVDVFTYDEDNLLSALTSLQENSMHDIVIDKNVLTGKLDTNKDGILFLTFPYDENFKIYVDGKKVDYFSVLDKSFIGLNVTTGSHDIKVEYTNDSLALYIIASIGSLLVTLILYFVINRKLDNKINLEKEQEEMLKAKRLENKSNKGSKNNKKKKK